MGTPYNQVIPNLKDAFTGEVTNIPTDIEYPNVVPQGTFERMAGQRPVNPAMLAQQGMIDMLPLLSGMYGSANTEKSASTVAGIIQNMINGYSKAAGAEGDITNLVQKNQNAAEILGYGSQAKSPMEMAMLIAAGKTFGGTEIPKEAITYGTVSPSQIITDAVKVAGANMGSNAAKADNDAKYAQIAATLQASQAGGAGNLDKMEYEATKDFYNTWNKIGEGLDDKDKAARLEASFPFQQKQMQRFPNMAINAFVRNYMAQGFDSREPIEKFVDRMATKGTPITPEQKAQILAIAGKTPKETPATNTSNPAKRVMPTAPAIQDIYERFLGPT